MYTVKAQFMALVDRSDDEGPKSEYVPAFILDGIVVPSTEFGNYLGMVAPGQDALDLSFRLNPDHLQKHRAWRKSNGITQLIVGAE